MSLCEPGKGTLRCYTSICDGIISFNVLAVLFISFSYTALLGWVDGSGDTFAPGRNWEGRCSPSLQTLILSPYQCQTVEKKIPLKQHGAESPTNGIGFSRWGFNQHPHRCTHTSVVYGSLLTTFLYVASQEHDSYQSAGIGTVSLKYPGIWYTVSVDNKPLVNVLML